MKFYRSKITAAGCKFLGKMATVKHNVAYGLFTCNQEDVCTIPERVSFITIDSLDFCCTCEYFEKEEE